MVFTKIHATFPRGLPTLIVISKTSIKHNTVRQLTMMVNDAGLTHFHFNPLWGVSTFPLGPVSLHVPSYKPSKR